MISFILPTEVSPCLQLQQLLALKQDNQVKKKRVLEVSNPKKIFQSYKNIKQYIMLQNAGWGPHLLVCSIQSSQLHCYRQQIHSGINLYLREKSLHGALPWVCRNPCIVFHVCRTPCTVPCSACAELQQLPEAVRKTFCETQRPTKLIKG